jgi:hypothetical protein
MTAGRRRRYAARMVHNEDRGLARVVMGDGVPLLLLTATGLLFAGGFAMFLAVTGEFLPHDMRYLGMTSAELCAVADCRVVDFMIHDRSAFGGALFAIGSLYAYLALFPLRRGEAWAWWLLVVSGAFGFATFLGYFSFGYLDTWHGIGTAALLPVFVLGLARTRRLIGHGAGPVTVFTTGRLPDLRTRGGFGRACLLVSAAGTVVAGLAIFGVGLTDIFVPQDLAFMRVTAGELEAVNPRLVPLIAHDRVGFGGAVVTTGLTALGCLWCAPMSRALWEILAVSGGISLSAAIIPHLVIGYTDVQHLGPACLAAAAMVIGLALTRPATRARSTAVAAPAAAPAEP